MDNRIVAPGAVDRGPRSCRLLRLITLLIPALVLGLSVTPPAAAQQEGKGDAVTISGLVIPRDNDGMYLRNSDGRFEIEWTNRTQVALQVNTRMLRGLRGDVLRYRVQSSTQVIDFPWPKGPITAVVKLRGPGRVEKALQVAKAENWIPEFGLVLRFGERLEEQLPTRDDPRFVGLWDPTSRPRTLSINGRKYELSLKKGGQTTALLFGMIGRKDCKPFVNRARVIGRRKGEVIIADQVHVAPIGDQTANDDPRLPRYLFIGDSISGNYNKGLRAALAGRFNVHHPPTNCGPSGKGKNSIVAWLGAYEQTGRHWNVISFNFGHWDAGNDKTTYQSNLEAVIKELKKTGARLIWVTTCPVPRGFPPAGGLSSVGKAPRRTSGVMQQYLNPWALEVVKRHPEISICDQWKFVKDQDEDLYQEWWAGKNVHFRGQPAAALGEFLAERVLKVVEAK